MLASKTEKAFAATALDSSSGNQRQEDSKNREAWVRRPADRRSVEWLGRRGGRRLRACWRVGDRGRGGDGNGCWGAGPRAAFGRKKKTRRPEPPLGGAGRSSGGRHAAAGLGLLACGGRRG